MVQQVEQEVVDPVCGMTISPADSVGEVVHRGHTYYFCNESCLERFKANPEEFVGAGGGGRTSAVGSDPDAEYTCPMHPEIRQKGPGSCPICGMALEPVNVSLDEQPNEELEDMTRRFRWSLALTVPILLVMVDEFVPGQPLHERVVRLKPDATSGFSLLNWFELALATPVVLWGGWPFFARGWASLVSRHLNMFTLIALGVGAAYGFSVFATVAPDLFPHSFRMGGAVAVYFEPAAAIVVLVLLGPGPRAARPEPDERRDSQPPRARPGNGAAHRCGWNRARRVPRRRPRQRSAQSAAGRTDPRRRRRDRGGIERR